MTKQTAIFFETPRLLLRPFEDRDAAIFSAYRSDPEVARYQGWDAPFSLETAVEYVNYFKEANPGEVGKWYQVAIELKSEGVLIGDIGFKTMSYMGRQGEIGFTLARAYQGRGYASEAVGNFLDYMFITYNLHRVQANCDPRNIPSFRLLERVGMRREGHIIEGLWFKGEWADELLYAILRREWEARQASG